jgi:Domain of unknown function (DUF5666)
MSQAPAAEPHSRTETPQTPETSQTSEMSAEELLAIPPQADHLAEELAARPVRAKLPRATLVLGGAILVAAGFIGGTLAQKHYGTSSGGTAARAASFASAFTRGTGAGAGRTGTGGFGAGGGFGGTAGGSSISGTVTVVSGDTLYVTAANGTVYTVKTSGTTTVSISSSGTLSQLKPGQTVTIAGSADSNGDVTATSITAATK